ncbi:biotin-protein ligase [Elysia marginata]|uniref:Biotin-protein ligase n=1 Tax=Elysia marginata TaxID=1093978 RepID=A0AAV4G4R5_9GAST|nr:biotin-protein ligase [Elysia marginata]
MSIEQERKTQMKSTILVYNGEGSQGESRKFFHEALVEVVDPRYHNIKYISPEEIKEGSWTWNCCLIAFGGGYDLGFIKALGSQGTQTIRQYVEQGGTYLGFCAGAYWACNYIEFDKGGPLEVVGERFLKFYPGSCIGPAFPGFGYKNKVGVQAVPVTYKGLAFSSYLHGGGFFSPPEVPSKAEPSVSNSSHQQNVIGVSEEYTVTAQNCKMKTLSSTNDAVLSQGEEQDLHSRPGPPQNRLCSPKSPAHTNNLVNTTTGLCMKREDRTVTDQRTYDVLGAFTTLSGSPAVFVKCYVGQGRALLSGVHIEYPVVLLDENHPILKPVMPSLHRSEEARDFVFRDILLQAHVKLKKARSLL